MSGAHSTGDPQQSQPEVATCTEVQPQHDVEVEHGGTPGDGDTGKILVRPVVEPEPASVVAVFGEQTETIRRYAELLVTDGVLRGALGPREAARIWSRHLLNCAVVSELFDGGDRIVDVGSGAGLPGVALAIRRPDLHIDLVEPMQRRVDYLNHVVHELELDERVRVVRGRADESSVIGLVGGASWVTARAVAPLDRLVRWCVPLAAPGGRLALIKGASAVEELAQYRPAVTRMGVAHARVVSCGGDVVVPATRVITMQVSPGRPKRRGAR